MTTPLYPVVGLFPMTQSEQGTKREYESILKGRGGTRSRRGGEDEVGER